MIGKQLQEIGVSLQHVTWEKLPILQACPDMCTLLRAAYIITNQLNGSRHNSLPGKPAKASCWICDYAPFAEAQSS